MKTFYINGTIVTMEDSALYTEAAAVENGQILAVGNHRKNAEIQRAKKTFRYGLVMGM